MIGPRLAAWRCTLACGALSWPLSAEPAVATPPAPHAEPVPNHGFVAAASVGPGLFLANSGAPGDTRRFSGQTLSLGLFMGGHLAPSFTLGGAYLLDEVFGLRSKDAVVDGDEPNLDKIHFALGSLVFVGDGRIAAAPELHLQGFVGFGALYVTGRSAPDIDNPSGLVWGLVLSSEFRLAEHFLLGPALRFTDAPFSVTELGGTSVNIAVPALMVAGRYD
jgi:hypothetical protein